MNVLITEFALTVLVLAPWASKELIVLLRCKLIPMQRAIASTTALAEVFVRTMHVSVLQDTTTLIALRSACAKTSAVVVVFAAMGCASVLQATQAQTVLKRFQPPK